MMIADRRLTGATRMESTAVFSALALCLWLAGCSPDQAVGPSGGAGTTGFDQQATGGSGGFIGPVGSGGSMGPAGMAASGGAPAPSGSGGAIAAMNGSGGITGVGNAGSGGNMVHGTGGSMADAGADAANGSGGAGDKTGPTFHVFLLLGQSNMAGYPKAQDADKVENPRITVLGYDNCQATGRQQDQWDVAVPPLHECWNGAIGPGDYFSKTLIDTLPEGDTIGLVPCAISGEKIETFLKSGGTKYAWIIQRAQLAQQAGGMIEGILFHQGESNNGDPSWPGKVNTLITDLRADLALGDVPVLAGELAYDGPGAGHNTLVNMLPTVTKNAYVVSASGLALDPADTTYHLHFGHDAQVTFGMRYAAKMIEALHW